MSEVMLQQTQALRVIPKYQAFLEAFPTPAACAVVPLGDVLRLWQGLGYPRRARNLQATAIRVVELGAFPDTLETLMALPGVGAYTARAVLAFAFEVDAAVVDTNIARVYARVEGRRLSAKDVQAAADEALPLGDAWVWNQSLMDLGAVLCRPGRPACEECPLVQHCAWHGEGPDPASGSAGVSVRQAPFEGSDRQARGRLLHAAAIGGLAADRLAEITGRDANHASTLADSLVADGLLVRAANGVLTLP